MGLFGKLAFWKKSDSFDFEKPPDFGGDMPNENLGLRKSDEGLGLAPEDRGVDTSPTGYLKEGEEWSKPLAFKEPQPGAQQRDFQPNQPFTVTKQDTGDFDFKVNKDFEIISSKLDALRSALDSMNQRLMNVEEMVRREQENKRRW